MVPGSPNTLSASWDIPEPTNGIISGYTINCNSSISVTVNGSTLSASLSGLTPFTTYSCTISASTGAGEGNASNTVTAATDEDGKQQNSMIYNSKENTESPSRVYLRSDDASLFVSHSYGHKHTYTGMLVQQ